MEHSNPSMSSRFLSLPADLFLLTRLNTLSIPALECSVINISFSTLNSNSNLSLFPTKGLNRWMWHYKASIRYSFEPPSYSLILTSSQAADDSSESLKNSKSINSSNNFSISQPSYWRISLYFSTKYSTCDHLVSWQDWKSINCAVSQKLELTSILRSVCRKLSL